MRSVCDIQYKQNLLLNLYLPDEDTFDLFVYFHGGGLTQGSRNGKEVFAKTLADRQVATASVDYRMYPNAKFPDFIEDCACAVRFLKDNISKWGKCGRIFVGGSSAGGYISMMLCFDQRYLNAVGLKADDIDGYVHDAGQPTSHFNVLREFGKDHKRLIVDETAPMYFVGTEERYPPMQFVVSDHDMFGRYEQTMLMIRVLEHFGHKDKVFLDVRQGKHCEYVTKADQNGDGVFGHIVLSFIDKVDGVTARTD